MDRAARLRLTRVTGPSPRRRLAGLTVLGLVLAGLAAAAAASVYDAVAEKDGVAAWDQPVLDAMLRLRSPGLNQAVTAFTDLGGPVLLPVLGTAGALLVARWRRSWMPVLLTAVAVAGSLTMTVVGKAVVGRVRPPLAEAVPPYESSPSFPSGHSLNSLVLAGVLAYLVARHGTRWWARVLVPVLAALFAVGIGLSRVYLGHHWLSDVLVGWALGSAWLATVLTVHEWWTSRGGDRRPGRPPGGPGRVSR
jgi:membrane-associated phospholipid phosphatase